MANVTKLDLPRRFADGAGDILKQHPTTAGAPLTDNQNEGKRIIQLAAIEELDNPRWRGYSWRSPCRARLRASIC